MTVNGVLHPSGEVTINVSLVLAPLDGSTSVLGSQEILAFSLVGNVKSETLVQPVSPKTNTITHLMFASFDSNTDAPVAYHGSVLVTWLGLCGRALSEEALRLLRPPPPPSPALPEAQLLFPQARPN